jgi:hypothetical protein
MDLRLSSDVFRRRDTRRIRVDRDLLGAEAHVALDPAFVTGLRDWRRTPDMTARQAVAVSDLRAIQASRPAADAADGEWQPL